MNCRRLKRSAKPAPLWHRLWCRACRTAVLADAEIAYDVARMRTDVLPIQGLDATLDALDTRSFGNQLRRLAWRRGRRTLFRFVGGCTAFVGLTVGWLLYANTIPDPHVPMPIMPNPNAFDYYVRAAKMLTRKNELEAVTSAKPDMPVMVKLPNGKQEAHSYSLKEKIALIAENEPAFATLQQGLAYRYQNPPVRSFKTLLPYYADFRSLARALNLKSKVEAERGAWGTAVNASLDAVQMGEAMPHGSPLIGELVGIACQAIGHVQIWKAVPHLNAQEAKAASHRLEGITALHLSYADVLQEEKWCGQAGLAETFHYRDPRKALVEFVGLTSGTGVSMEERAMQNLLLLFWNKRVSLACYSHYMDQIIANARQPYAMHPAEPSIPFDPLGALLCPVFAQAYFKNAFIETQNALLLVSLALQAYRQEQGHYPDTLDALVPTYLSRVPNDPFANHRTLRYRRDGDVYDQRPDGHTTKIGNLPQRTAAPDHYTLYSVGPDGKDDGGLTIVKLQKEVGQPRQEQSEEAKIRRYMVEPDSQGDIVAGINTR